jgi:hypothetical protein
LHLWLEHSEVPAGEALCEGYEEGSLLKAHWRERGKRREVRELKVREGGERDACKRIEREWEEGKGRGKEDKRSIEKIATRYVYLFGL